MPDIIVRLGGMPWHKTDREESFVAAVLSGLDTPLDMYISRGLVNNVDNDITYPRFNDLSY